MRSGSDPMTSGSRPMRSGFVALVGRPNVGKSTLLNALVGEKVAITSDRPQTTRRAIRGILNLDDAQIVFVDTPGLHRPRTLLGERLGELVRDTLADVDLTVFLTPATEKIGPGDRHLAQLLDPARTIAVASKADIASREQLARHLVALSELAEWAEIVPVSAVADENVTLLAELLAKRLPEGPRLFLDDEATDETQTDRIAELVREAALAGAREELPHSIAVVVEEIDRSGPKPVVRADIYVERDSQKPMIIGKGGARLRDIGSSARAGIEDLLGEPIYLDLHVRVAKDWQRDPKLLARLGF